MPTKTITPYTPVKLQSLIGVKFSVPVAPVFKSSVEETMKQSRDMTAMSIFRERVGAI